MKYLITGATGKLGAYAVESILKRIEPESLIVSVRNPEKAKHLVEKGIEVRKGDFDEPEALMQTFKGVDHLAIISTDGDNETRIRQHLNAVKAAKAANVKLIVYTSASNAQESTLGLAIVHKTTETAIIESGIPYVILRNNWYLENEISSMQSVLNGGPWITAAGNGKVGWALKSDYAEAIASVLTGEGHTNKIYELSNRPITQHELATLVGRVSGKKVEVLNVSDENYADGLTQAGFPAFVVSLFTDIQRAIREKALDIESDDFEKVLGHPTTSMEDAIKSIIDTL